MLIQINILITLIICSASTTQHHYNLYYTDLAKEGFTRDCLYFEIVQESEYDGKRYEIQQLLEYCIRLSSREEDQLEEGLRSTILTFDRMKEENISVEELIEWSSPVDVIERYLQFLDMDNVSLISTFHKCSERWFGSNCQFKFPLDELFSTIVAEVFVQKVAFFTGQNITCYIHMKCDRGSSLFCLDWREICDGKIDCIDGGEDEKYCDELYTNQCNESEYQCRNGMCIDKIFLIEATSSRILNFECLDRSDEPLITTISTNCLQDPSFKCEESGCYDPTTFSCGDGSCIAWPLLRNGFDCGNHRDYAYHYLFQWFDQKTSRLPRCFKIQLCALNFFSPQHFNEYCKPICTSVQQCFINKTECPTYYFAPDFPVWDGHVRFGFFINQTIIKASSSLIPHFICFDQQRCPFLIPSFKIENYSCLHSDKQNFSYTFKFYEMFLSCIQPYQIMNAKICSYPGMFHCSETNKCIPNSHVMDGIQDCYNAFDESVAADSCSLDKQNRFQCTSENKCLLIPLVNDRQDHCIGMEDEYDENIQATHIEQLPFSALCDGRQELLSSTNETDETDCDQWLCANQYTRCNAAWNCPKGIDEVNCPSAFNCPKDHHPCFYPKAKTIGCIHIDRVDDGTVDCLGATDERKFCRQSYPDEIHKRYRCWNDSTCVSFSSRCRKCKAMDDAHELCPSYMHPTEAMLEYFDETNDILLARKRSFSHKTSRSYPFKQPLLPNTKETTETILQTTIVPKKEQLNHTHVWFCNRGILVYHGRNETKQCFCPPSYFGDRCQFQNQRVSLTLLFHNENFDRFSVIGIIVTLIDSTNLIHSYEQLTYTPLHNCYTKFNIYLLYQDRPKDMKKNYTILIYAYDKVHLTYLTHWRLPVKFPFMPVNRVSAPLTIPARQRCHGTSRLTDCKQKSLVNPSFCRCEPSNTNIISISRHKCNCSPDSLCIGIVNNRSICLCPLTKVSPRCLVKSICYKNICMNDGLCIPVDDRISFKDFKCVCKDGFSGRRCEQKDLQINLSFSDVKIPQAILIHFITIPKPDYSVLNQKPIRATMFKKIAFDQETVTFFMSLPFHMVFAQIQNEFYLAILQHEYVHSTIISTEIASSQYCPHTQQLFNESIHHWSILRQVKYYHLLCMRKLDLVCFHDNQLFMCLCTEERHANCFHFDFNMTYNCGGVNKCQNEAQCFQDNPTCPTKMMCVCRECYYGTHCQFTTKQFGLSLDAILGYQIRPHVSIHRQSIYVKISIAAATLMLFIGITSGILSIFTFQSKVCQQYGRGIYLLASSVTSVLTIIGFNIKLWFLVLSQMSLITSRNVLLFSCISTEYLLRILLAVTDWYHAAIAIEQLATLILHVNFNRNKSKRIAKLLTFIIFMFTCVSLLHDPIYRRLIDDEEEQRIWCLVSVTRSIKVYNSFINIFHFVVPFILKLVSTVGIISFIAKKCTSNQTQNDYINNLKEQFYKHKNLIISAGLLIILALPRLILAFLSGCMKSARKPTIFLIGYFVSFIPCLLTFFVFIFTSKTYRDQLKLAITYKTHKMRLLFKR